jgi:hypothetical protein
LAEPLIKWTSEPHALKATYRVFYLQLNDPTAGTGIQSLSTWLNTGKIRVFGYLPTHTYQPTCFFYLITSDYNREIRLMWKSEKRGFEELCQDSSGKGT